MGLTALLDGTDCMVIVDNVYKKYGARQILTGVSLEAAPGQIVAVAGRNGCGKSTLLQIISGALKPDGGEIKIYNKDARKDKRVFAKFIGYVPQDDPLFSDLSVRDNLKFWAAGVKNPDTTVIETFGLNDIMNKPVRTLSGGMRRRLSIAWALQRKTPVLILDEPTSALDIYYQDEIRAWMKDYAAHNGTIILSTHNVEELKAADKVYFLTDGKMTLKEATAIDEDEIRKEFLISDK